MLIICGSPVCTCLKIDQSMARVGLCFDHAAAESFFIGDENSATVLPEAA